MPAAAADGDHAFRFTQQAHVARFMVWIDDPRAGRIALRPFRQDDMQLFALAANADAGAFGHLIQVYDRR